MIDTTKLYPLASPYSILPHPLSANLRARATGEKRPPKKGEWYLSGAIVEAYKAPNDLTTAYYIAKIVRIETVTQEVVIEVLSSNPEKE